MKTTKRSMQAVGSIGLILLCLAAMPMHGAAQDDPGPLRVAAVNLTAQQEGRVPPEGDENPASRPGDVIEYRLFFTNTGDGPVRDVVFDDPIPVGLVYVLGSAGGDGEGLQVAFSIDGGATYTATPEVETLVEGRTVRNPAPAERYTHVRWTIPGPVPPNQEVRAVFQARIAGGISR